MLGCKADGCQLDSAPALLHKLWLWTLIVTLFFHNKWNIVVDAAAHFDVGSFWWWQCNTMYNSPLPDNMVQYGVVYYYYYIEVAALLAMKWNSSTETKCEGCFYWLWCALEVIFGTDYAIKHELSVIYWAGKKRLRFFVSDEAPALLQKAFDISVMTTVDTSSYISDTLQLLNMESVLASSSWSAWIVLASLS